MDEQTARVQIRVLMLAAQIRYGSYWPRIENIANEILMAVPTNTFRMVALFWGSCDLAYQMIKLEDTVNG